MLAGAAAFLLDSRLIDAAEHAAATLLLAHGAGAPMDSPFMAAIATGLVRHGLRVVRFEFPYMAHSRATGRRRAPDRLPVLQQAFRDQVAIERQTTPSRPLFIGGKSMGGRVASLLVDALAAEPDGVRGCLCLGYPLHPPGRPQQRRSEHLRDLRTPTLILQGERDSFGTPEELRAEPLSSRIRIIAIPSGDHSFRPTRRSGLSEADNLAAAVDQAAAFLRGLLQDPAADSETLE